MTRVHIDGIGIIEVEPVGKCEFCGETKETRPYGPGGKEICFKCAMSTPERKAEASKRFGAFVDPSSDGQPAKRVQ